MLCVVDPRRDRADLLLDRQREIIGEIKAIRLSAQAHHLFSQRNAARAASGPDLAADHAHAERAAALRDQRELGLGVGREDVERDRAGQPEQLPDVGHMPQQIGQAPLERLRVLAIQPLLRHAAVVFERARSRPRPPRTASFRPCGT